MNMANNSYSEQEADYQESDSVRGGKEKINRQENRPSYSRNRKGPAAFNGLHRRRNKRFSW